MTTIGKINSLRHLLYARQNRVAAIGRRIDAIRAEAPSMTLEQLLAAKKETDELGKELQEHASFIRKAKKEIADFYKPASLIA